MLARPLGVPYHTIYGTEDPVVSYESAHLPGAESEFICESRHDIQEHPAAIAEVLRILRVHVE